VKCESKLVIVHSYLNDFRIVSKFDRPCNLYAVHALSQQLNSIHNLLKSLSTQRDVNADTMSGALRLLKCIDFKFICPLNLWSKILSLIDRINKSLQATNVSVLNASNTVKGLMAAIQKLRDNNGSRSGIYSSAKEQLMLLD